MAKTKTTPRSIRLVCPACKETIKPDETFEHHLETCGTERIQCEKCPQTFKKKVYHDRHVKKKHEALATMTEQKETGSMNEPSDSESDWDKEPDIQLSDEESDLTLGRVIRKRTIPEPVSSGLKRKLSDPNEAKAKKMATDEKGIQERPKVNHVGVQVNLQENKQTKGRCNTCGINFDDRAMLCVHMGCHTPGDELRCNVCDTKCSGPREFFLHLTMGHDDRM